MTDRMKTIFPPIFDLGGIKIPKTEILFEKLYLTDVFLLKNVMLSGDDNLNIYVSHQKLLSKDIKKIHA